MDGDSLSLYYHTTVFSALLQWNCLRADAEETIVGQYRDTRKLGCPLLSVFLSLLDRCDGEVAIELLAFGGTDGTHTSSPNCRCLSGSAYDVPDGLKFVMCT
eukprot:Selendium_serpulae@DN4000_c0_g1_i1.p1